MIFTNFSSRTLLHVRHSENSEAEVTLYRLNDSGGEYSIIRKGLAYIGKNGIGKTREGDGKTPLGSFGVVTAFGINPDPGTALPYLTIDSNTVACDEDCPYYNTIIDISQTGSFGGEHMIDFSPEYNYGLALDFNAANIYPNGSAIFVHCKGQKKFTGGCVAVDESFMKDILTLSDSSLKVIIE